jgi:hypothetical protein
MENTESKTPAKSEASLSKEERRAALDNYDKRVRGMSHRQLVKELRRVSNDGSEGSGLKLNGADFGQSATPKNTRKNGNLDSAMAAVLGVILENTVGAKVLEFKENGNPRRYARKDQIGNGKMQHYLS